MELLIGGLQRNGTKQFSKCTWRHHHRVPSLNKSQIIPFPRFFQIAAAYLVEEDLVVNLLFQLSLGPFLRKVPTIKLVRYTYFSSLTPSPAHIQNYAASKLIIYESPPVTFFFPLLELAAAMAFCSFVFCSLGACTEPSNKFSLV